MSYQIGIDVGSTTLKTVVLDDKGHIVEKSYQRHFSKVREMTLRHLASLEPLLGEHSLKVAVTGSAGLGIAKDSELEFVQEVFATAGAVRRTDERGAHHRAGHLRDGPPQAGTMPGERARAGD